MCAAHSPPVGSAALAACSNALLESWRRPFECKPLKLALMTGLATEAMLGLSAVRNTSSHEYSTGFTVAGNTLNISSATQ